MQLILMFGAALLNPASDLEPTESQRPYFELMRVQEAWDLLDEDQTCRVGVLDTGFDFFHPALRETLAPGFYASGVHHLGTSSLIAHGTSMASLIAARHVGEADQGMTGLAPQCTIVAAAMGMPRHLLTLMQFEFFRDHPAASMADFQKEMAARQSELADFGRDWIDYVTRTASEGLRALVDDGARVINFSAFVGRRVLSTYPDFAARLDQAFAYAAEQDVLILIGAGNTGQEEPNYPGTPETVLVVGASTLNDQRWEIEVESRGMKIVQGSCYGPRLSVVACQENLVTARPHDEASYRFADAPMGPERTTFNGAYEIVPYGATSMATAVTTALAALVRGARPDLKISEVIEVIQQGAVDLDPEGWDPMTGHGRIDFQSTLELALDHE